MNQQTLNQLNAILARDGIITPAAVEEAARDEASPLHSHFTWDDTEAARQWRLHEARQLIRAFTVTIVNKDETLTHVRAFVNIVQDGQRGYVSTEEALKGQHRDVVLQQALREVAHLRRKYAALIDFDEVLHQSLVSV